MIVYKGNLNLVYFFNVSLYCMFIQESCAIRYSISKPVAFSSAICKKRDSNSLDILNQWYLQLTNIIALFKISFKFYYYNSDRSCVELTPAVT